MNVLTDFEYRLLKRISPGNPMYAVAAYMSTSPSSAFCSETNSSTGSWGKQQLTLDAGKGKKRLK